MPFRPAMFYSEAESQYHRLLPSNSLLRVKVGDEAEVVFDGVPGRVFPARVKQVTPVVPQGAYQAGNAMQSISFDGRNGIS